MNKIKRVSKIFRLFFQFLFLTLPVVLVFGWVSAPHDFVALHGTVNFSVIPRSYENLVLHELTTSDRLFGFGVSFIALSVVLYMLYSLIQLFKLYEQGEIFSLSNVRYIRNIGYALLLTQVVHPIYEFLMGIALTLHNPPGHRLANISVDQNNLGIIFAGCIVILISWIMAEACKLREEQQLTI